MIGMDPALKDEALFYEGPIIVTVHGTFAARDTSAGDSWWQRGSDFQRSVADQTYPAKEPFFLPFHWSGANREDSRRSASRVFRKEIREIARNRSGLVILAHSHGGNVVRSGLIGLSKDMKKNMHVVSFGTPFISPRYRLGQKFAVLGGLIGMILMLLIGIGSLAFGKNVQLVLLGAAGAIAVSYIYDLLRIAIRHRLEKPSTEGWTAIHHVSDEAIAALADPDEKNLKIVGANDIAGIIKRMFIVFCLLEAGAIAGILLGELPTWGPILLVTLTSLVLSNFVMLLFLRPTSDFLERVINRIFRRLIWKQSFGLSFFDNTPTCHKLPVVDSTSAIREIEYDDADFGSSKRVDRAFELEKLFMLLLTTGAPEEGNAAFQRFSNDMLIHNNYFTDEAALTEVVGVVERII